MHSYRVTPHLEGHKQTKQKVCSNYFCDTPIQNSCLKHVWISTHTSGCQSFKIRWYTLNYHKVDIYIIKNIKLHCVEYLMEKPVIIVDQNVFIQTYSRYSKRLSMVSYIPVRFSEFYNHINIYFSELFLIKCYIFYHKSL